MGATMDVGTNRAVDTHEVWSSVLAILKEQVPEPSFRTWLESTRLCEVEDTRSAVAMTTVAVPSTFAAEWLERRYRTPITDALKACLGRSVGVLFKVEPVRSHRAIRALDGIGGQMGRQSEQAQLPIAVGQSGPVSPTPQVAGRSQTRAEVINTSSAAAGATGRGNTLQWQDRGARLPQGVQGKPVAQRTNRDSVASNQMPIPALNPRYTFERFLVGRGNQLAASVARRVAEGPGAAYNPLFIYGHRGVGKTHLLQAIGHDARVRVGANVLFISAMQFEGSSAGSRLGNPETIDGVDLLLVDDLHHIAGAGGRPAQRSLAVLVEGMLAAGKGVVVTATQPPDSMLALDETLRFRLRGGMVVTIELPDSELRMRMVRRLAGEADVLVAERVLEMLASAGQSMAEVHTAWERARARSFQRTGPVGPVINEVQSQGTICVQDVQAMLAERQSRSRIGPETIIDRVASYFDLETNELSSSSRERRVMMPRHIAMYLIREETDRSYEWIAHRFARQDHTTAMYACAKIGGLLETDLNVRQMVLELRQMVYGEHQQPYVEELAS